MVGSMGEKESYELKNKGYARTSHALAYYLRKNASKGVDSNFRIFRPGVSTTSGGKGSRFSSIDVFGDYHSYFYYIEKKERFVEFLVSKFLAKNKDPDANIRRVFTRILHNHGLHWYGCCCVGKG